MVVLARAPSSGWPHASDPLPTNEDLEQRAQQEIIQRMLRHGPCRARLQTPPPSTPRVLVAQCGSNVTVEEGDEANCRP